MVDSVALKRVRERSFTRQLGCFLAIVSVITLPVVGVRPAAALSLTFGALDAVYPNNNGTAVVTGWAATSDNKTQALGVRARIDGNLVLAPNEYRFANKYRPDVATNVCCGYSAYLGSTFTIPWPADLPATTHHTVCIEVQNSGVYNQISCLPENIPGRTAPIISQTTVNRWNFFGGTYNLFPGVAVAVTYFRPADGFAGDIDAAMNSWQASQTNVTRTRILPTSVWNLAMKAKTTPLVALIALAVVFSGCGKTTQRVANAGSTTSTAPSDSSTQQVSTVQGNRLVFNSLAELSKASVAVITGKVAAVGNPYIDEGSKGEGGKDAKHGIVLTPVSFTVESVVAGDPKDFGKTVNFLQLGGSTPEVKTVNPDDSFVKVGDSLLLFLSNVDGADVVTAGGPGGRFTLKGETVVDAAANGDGAAAQLKSKTVKSLAGPIAQDLGSKDTSPQIPSGTTTTVAPGEVGSVKKPPPSPETTIT
jgi:hypothetical protein